MRRVSILAALALLTLLGGCGLFGEKSNLAPPSALTHFQPTLSITQVWSRDTGNGTGGYAFTLHPALAQGVVYVANEDGTVAAYRATDGERLWRKHLKARITGGVGFGQGLVVVGTRRGLVMALRFDTGAIVWQAQAPSEILAAPVVGPHGVYVASLDGHVTAFGLGHGEILWVASHVEPALKLFLTDRPILNQDVLYEGYANGEVVALRSQDGERVWTTVVARPRGGDAVERLVDVGQAVLGQSLIYVAGYHGNAVALSADSGHILWSDPLSSDHAMALGAQSLYAVTSQSGVVALASATGGSLWSQNALLNRRLGAPALAGPAVVVGDFAGYTHWLSRRTGALMARKRVGEGAIRAAPLVASVTSDHGLPYVFVLSTTGRLTALRFEPKSP
ncbi:MAG TPA: outer membrane protein assembly factor BamB [Acidiferrobacter sp.]|nr:outer membrane protein assembly factor BamB [Acidiferrobacter sp.]